MYSAFSEAIRHALFFISNKSLCLAKNGFQYQGLFYNEKDCRLMVKYTFNGQALNEPCDKFTRSPYIRTLSNKQLNDIINKTAEFKAKNKIYVISLLDDTPDIFVIKNITTNLSEERLLSDIISDSKLLEKSSADSIRLIINSAIKLTNSGYSIISTSCDSDITEIEHKLKRDNHIIPFPSRKIINIIK
jgi:hypothetical protein